MITKEEKILLEEEFMLFCRQYTEEINIIESRELQEEEKHLQEVKKIYTFFKKIREK